MSAVNWMQRARDFLKASPPPTDKTDERGVLSVLSVHAPLVFAKTEAANEYETTKPPDVAEPCTSDPDRWCWPHGIGWNTAEIDTFMSRTTLFNRRGISATQADDLAGLLVLRDRDRDSQRLCLECVHLSGNA
jgi:hypothetical protein